MQSDDVVGVVMIMLLLLAIAFIVGWNASRGNIKKCLLTDGYEMIIDESKSLGHGKYTIRLLERQSELFYQSDTQEGR